MVEGVGYACGLGLEFVEGEIVVEARTGSHCGCGRVILFCG